MQLCSKRQMIKSYKEKWGKVYCSRLPINVDYKAVENFLKLQGLINYHDFFTDESGRRWYFKDSKWSVTLKLIYG